MLIFLGQFFPKSCGNDLIERTLLWKVNGEDLSADEISIWIHEDPQGTYSRSGIYNSSRSYVSVRLLRERLDFNLMRHVLRCVSDLAPGIAETRNPESNDPDALQD